MIRKSVSKYVGRSAITTVAAVVMTAILVGSIVGGAGYVYSMQTDTIVSELKSENSRLGSQVQASKDETSKLNSKIAAMQDEGKNLKSLNDQLNSQIKTVADDSNRLKSQLSSLSTDLKAVADAAGIPLSNGEELKKLVEERKMIEAAKQEGRLVIYSDSDSRVMEALRGAFERKYPSITVEIVSGAGGVLAPRFIGEFGKGTKSADVLMVGGAVLRTVLERGQLLAKYVPKDTEWIPADQKDRDGRWVAHNIAIWSIAYNTKLVSKDEVPKNFRDLTNPKWKGRIIAVDPRISPAFTDAFRSLEKLLGEDFMSQLATQNIRYYNGVEALDRLSKGEFPILLVMSISFIEPPKRAGLPIDWVRAADNTYFNSFSWTGITANAPHPNAARLWVDLLMSKEGNQIQADIGGLPPMPNIRLPNQDMALQGKRLVSVEYLSDAERKEMLAKYPGLVS